MTTEHHRAGEGGPEFRYCVFHKEHEFRLDANESTLKEVWGAINTIKNWVVVGAGSAILCLAGFLFEVLKPK